MWLKWWFQHWSQWEHFNLFNKRIFCEYISAPFIPDIYCNSTQNSWHHWMLFGIELKWFVVRRCFLCDLTGSDLMGAFLAIQSGFGQWKYCWPLRDLDIENVGPNYHCTHALKESNVLNGNNMTHTQIEFILKSPFISVCVHSEFYCWLLWSEYRFNLFEYKLNANGIVDSVVELISSSN